MFAYNSATSVNPCNPCCYFNTIGASVSRWCSDGSDSCSCGAPCMAACFAHLTQTEAITLAADQAIPFTGASILSEGFSFSEGMLSLTEPGVYRLDYQINIPRGAVVNTTFYVEAFDASAPDEAMAIAGTQRTVSHGNGDPELTVTIQAVFECVRPAMLQLVTTNPLALSPIAAGDLLASLTVLALC